MMDKKYIQALASSLNIKDGECLNMIVGPEELKRLLAGLTYDDFDDGKRLISLHNHTSASDGSIDPKDFLNNALNFKKQYGYKELILAITDHDTIDALPIVLKDIEQNFQRYQGIRLVLGCEISLSYFLYSCFIIERYEILIMMIDSTIVTLV